MPSMIVIEACLAGTHAWLAAQGPGDISDRLYDRSLRSITAGLLALIRLHDALPDAPDLPEPMRTNEGYRLWAEDGLSPYQFALVGASAVTADEEGHPIRGNTGTEAARARKVIEEAQRLVGERPSLADLMPTVMGYLRFYGELRAGEELFYMRLLWPRPCSAEISVVDINILS